MGKPIQRHGFRPTNINWSVVRGDTARLRVDFFDYDETTHWDTSDWSYAASTYDFRGDVVDELEVSAHEGYVIITAPAELTGNWGEGYEHIVADLLFDLKVGIDDDTVWTPIVGNIMVFGSVSEVDL